MVSSQKITLVILGILAVGLMASLVVSLIPKEANAQFFDNSGSRPFIDSLGLNPVPWGSGEINIDVYGEDFAPGAVVRLNGSDRTTTFINPNRIVMQLVDADTLRLGNQTVTVSNPGGRLSNRYTLNVSQNINAVTVSSTVTSTTPSASATINTSAIKSTTSSSTSKTPEKTDTATKEDYSNLASNAIYGGVGFMPSGIIQWLLLAILILLIVIIARKLYFEDKYQAKPLKHA